MQKIKIARGTKASSLGSDKTYRLLQHRLRLSCGTRSQIKTGHIILERSPRDVSGFHLISIYAVGGSPCYRKDPSPLGKGDQLPKGELVDEAVWRKGIRFQLNKKRTHHFGEIHHDVSNLFL